MGKDQTKIIDPTLNVKESIAIHAKHAADMANLRAEHQKEINAKESYIAELRATHQREISTKETERIDTVQKVVQQNTDRVATTAADAIKAQALAMVELASTLAAQKSISDDAMSKRVAALEMAKSEGTGKERFSEPVLLDLITKIGNLKTVADTTSGSTKGIRDTGGLIFNLIMVAVAVGSLLFMVLQSQGH